MKMKRKWNTKSQIDDNTRSGDANKFEERFAELERKSGTKPKLQPPHRKKETTESLKILKQTEGVVDAGVTI